MPTLEAGQGGGVGIVGKGQAGKQDLLNLF
jgi:ABC-type polysaccharide/polyol phosphate transport system ATPase subunit